MNAYDARWKRYISLKLFLKSVSGVPPTNQGAGATRLSMIPVCLHISDRLRLFINPSRGPRCGRRGWDQPSHTWSGFHPHLGFLCHPAVVSNDGRCAAWCIRACPVTSAIYNLFWYPAKQLVCALVPCFFPTRLHFTGTHGIFRIVCQLHPATSSWIAVLRVAGL